MTLLIQITMLAALLLSIIIPFRYFINGDQTVSRYKKAILSNALMFVGVIAIAGIFMFAGADSASAATAATSDGFSTGLGYVGAALATGLSCLGGGIAVASAASAALGAISEDPSALGKSLIFVGLAEGVCLYGLIISFMIIGKL